MKTETDIKEGIKEAPLCGYFMMNDLFRFGCLHLNQFQCDRDRLITTDNAFILRTHKFTSACASVSIFIWYTPPWGETVTSQPPEYSSGDMVCAVGDKTPLKQGGLWDVEGTTKGVAIAITENKQKRRTERGLLRQEAERSRPGFLYIGLVSGKLWARPQQWVRRAGVMTLLQRSSLDGEMRGDMIWGRDEAVTQVGF